MWHKLALTIWYIAASVLVLAAIVIGVLRNYPSLYQHYLPTIQGSISSVMGNPVYAKSISVVWDGYTPHITVKDLTIYSDNTKTEKFLFAKEVRLSFDLYESLVHQRFGVRQLTLIDSKLEVIWTADKEIIINGVNIGERFARWQKRDNGTTAVNFLNSAITVKDEVRNLTYLVDRADIAFSFYKDRFRAIANFSLPPALGNSLSLMADVQHFEQGLNNVRGNLYVKGSNISLGPLNDFFPHFQVGIKAGNSDFEVWGNFNSSVQSSFSGKLSIRGLQYHHVEKPIKGIEIGQEITAVDTRFQIKSEEENWYLVLVDSTVQAAGKHWFVEKYEVRCNDCNDSNFSVAVSLDRIDVVPLLSTLQHYPIFTASLEQVLTRTQIGGILENADILARWTEGRLSRYSYKAFLQDANVSILGQEFRVSSLVGTIHGNHMQGNLEVNAAKLHIQAGSVVSDLLEVQKVAGAIKWKHTNHGVITSLEGVLLESPGVQADLQGFIRTNDKGLYLDLQGKISETRLVAIKNYLSFRKINPKLINWLREGISSGTLRHARFVFRGYPGEFPFEDYSGVFQAIASVEGGTLDYYKDWPGVRNFRVNLKVENKRLVIVGHQGTILSSSVEHVTATIDDLKLPRLVIDGKVVGPASDLLDYLKRSSLISDDSQIPKNISVSGNTKLDFDVVLSLTKKLKKERTVSGVIDFDSTDMVVVPISLPFKNIKGKLKFNQDKIDSHNLSATLYGSTFKADTQGLKDGRLLLTIQGNFNIDSHFNLKHERAAEYISGIVPVKATVNLPRFGKHDGDKSLTVSIDSNLIGALITLPEPFYKEVDGSKKFALQIKYQAGKEYPLFVNFGNELFMKALFDEEMKIFSAAELRMGNDQFSLPEKGLKISGTWKQLNLPDWQGVFTLSSNGKFPELHEVNMYVDRVFVSGLEIKHVNFQLLKKMQSWAGKINSSVAKGSFSYPVDSSKGGVITADFDYLFLSKPEEGVIKIDPRKLPPLEVYLKQFEFYDYLFYDVTLKTTATDSGMEINSLIGKGKDLRVKADGVWAVDESNLHYTDLNIVATTENLHNSLVALGFDTVIEEGKGIFTAKFKWPGTPYQFSSDNLTGNANLDFDDGKISSVDPGAGRLIGIFNLGEISRRLSLDFVDFFSKGYVFKKIQGDLFFKDAHLNTENLIIKGFSADISITGRTGIKARDYDQIVTVTPHVVGGLPWIGLAVGGAIGAAGVYVGEKVVKKLGIDVNKVVEVKYSITGNWSHPKIEPIAKVEANSAARSQP